MSYGFCMLPLEHKYSRKDALFEWTLLFFSSSFNRLTSAGFSLLTVGTVSSFKLHHEATTDYNPVRTCLKFMLLEPGSTSSHQIHPPHKEFKTLCDPCCHDRNIYICSLKHPFSYKLASCFFHFKTEEEETDFLVCLVWVFFVRITNQF